MTKDRDKELADLEAELRAPPKSTPFVERPEEMDLGKGSLCWLDGSRRCAADCVAFNAEVLDEHGEAPDDFMKCRILAAQDVHTQNALLMISTARRAVTREQDRQREAAGGAPPLPDPFGGKKT